MLTAFSNSHFKKSYSILKSFWALKEEFLMKINP